MATMKEVSVHLLAGPTVRPREAGLGILLRKGGDHDDNCERCGQQECQ